MYFHESSEQYYAYKKSAMYKNPIFTEFLMAFCFCLCVQHYSKSNQQIFIKLFIKAWPALKHQIVAWPEEDFNLNLGNIEIIFWIKNNPEFSKCPLFSVFTVMLSEYLGNITILQFGDTCVEVCVHLVLTKSKTFLDTLCSFIVLCFICKYFIQQKDLI